MKLALRNRIAEWLLEAVADPAAQGPVRALVAFARRADSEGFAPEAPDVETRSLLGAGDLFESASGGIRLRPEYSSDLGALRTRALRFERALALLRDAPEAASDPASLPGLLFAAAALFNTRLFFEVHEILEPEWGRSSGALRGFLQGLIQVAVGLHHHENDNLRGALSLLGEGRRKLEPHAPAAWGVELERFCREIERLEEEVRDQLTRGAAAPLAVPELVVIR